MEQRLGSLDSFLPRLAGTANVFPFYLILHCKLQVTIENQMQSEDGRIFVLQLVIDDM